MSWQGILANVDIGIGKHKAEQIGGVQSRLGHSGALVTIVAAQVNSKSAIHHYQRAREKMDAFKGTLFFKDCSEMAGATESPYGMFYEIAGVHPIMATNLVKKEEVMSAFGA